MLGAGWADPAHDISRIDSNALTSVAVYYAQANPDAAFAAWKFLPPDCKLSEYASECLCREVASLARRAVLLAEILALPPRKNRTAGLKGALEFWAQNETLATTGV